MRYVSTDTGFWTDPDFEKWPAAALLLYRWLYENDHVHGISGIGRFNPTQARVQTKLGSKAIAKALAVIGDKVQWFDDWYWVIGRIKHTCFPDGHKHWKCILGVSNYLSSCPAELRKAVNSRYSIDSP